MRNNYSEVPDSLATRGLKIMLLQTIGSKFCVASTRLSVVGIRIDADATSGSEESSDLDVFRIHEANEIFHDDIDTVFVEIAMIAKGEEIEFEAFALYHLYIGDVRNTDFGEIRLASDGTERGELWAVEAHPVVIFLVLVDKRLEHFGCVVGGILSALASEMLEAFGFAL